MRTLARALLVGAVLLSHAVVAAAADTVTITLRDARVKESDEIRPGVIADFGYDGGVLGFEILQASKVVEQAGEMQFAIAG